MPLPPTTQTSDPLRAKDAFAGILAIAAVYVYFLIFAEFAFIENMRAVVHEGGLKLMMAALGLAGIAGSIIAAKQFDPASGSRQLAVGFGGCTLAAGLSLLANNPTLAIAVAIAVGGSLAWTTAMLVLCLRPTVQFKRLGLCCGLGTGLAYALCNQPPIFDSSPRAQTFVAIVAALSGFVISFRIRGGPVAKSSAPEYRPTIAAVWLILFLTLVWIDSAAFFIIQHSPHLKATTWAGLGALQSNAFVHFAAATLAGLALDRGQQPIAIGAALFALLIACVLLGQSGGAFPIARILYTAGVSIYSTALVFYPARGGRPWLAGLLYAASGWFGSAMGIGMVQSLHIIPVLFVAIAATVAVVALLIRHLGLKRFSPSSNFLPLLAAFLIFNPQQAHAEDPTIELGREVYIAEGCIHCHSQYVRTGTADSERWGPATPLANSLKQQPPLYGNRRQGPDLSQVASRRTQEWNRLHLIDPRSITPGSRMPSYAHLFEDPRGNALVAYLASLGSEAIAERLQIAQAWQPAPNTPILNVEKKRMLFAELCASCHGINGQGDGPLASKLGLRPPDFTHDPWRHANTTGVRLELQLARIVKFGQPGTPMAGHEYLTDSEIVSLAQYISGLHCR